MIQPIYYIIFKCPTLPQFIKNMFWYFNDFYNYLTYLKIKDKK